MTPQPNSEQEKKTPRVSAVVVSYNRRDLLRACLESLEKSDGREEMQLIVVDNGSSDGAAQLESAFPNAQFIKVPKNFGLTKAMNLGWRAAEAPYVFFLHDDTETEPGAVKKLAEVLDTREDAAATCPLLVDGEGRPAPQLGSLPPDGAWRPASDSAAEPTVVEYPRGAALMMRSRLIQAVRQIDERYGQFGADADLAAQIRRASKKILLVPDARVRHYGSDGYSTAEQADFQLARAAFVGKYNGFVSGLMARIGAVFGSLFGFRFGEFSRVISGQKIDGTQG